MMEFKPGINIIAGQNNAGKTALIDALNLNYQDIPHRSIKTLPKESSQVDPYSKATIVLTFDKSALHFYFEQIGSNLWIPTRNSDINDMEPIGFYKDWISSGGSADLEINFTPSLTIFESDNSLTKLNFNLYEVPHLHEYGSALQCLQIQRSKAEDYGNFGLMNMSLTKTIGWQLFEYFKRRIFRFYAERLNIGICRIGINPELAPNASNLAEVIHFMQSKKYSRFNKFNNLVSSIFPYIRRISSSPIGNDNVELIISTVDPDLDRDDLALPISACGTGIGQVLAILYVVMNSIDERVIIIDEPQSFLHPGAAKKLIEILRTEFSQHQYFISTHSPTIIVASNPSSIVMLQCKDGESVASVMDAQDSRDLRLLLDDIGVSLSDVFGADNILWVEGQTEEKCFPLILEKIGKRHLMGTTILAVSATGDFESKKKKGDYAANRVFEIYTKLSGKDSLVPPAIAFVFDREFRDEAKIKEMKKLSGDLAQFTPRTMYENYLLDPKAIAAIINDRDANRDKPLTDTDISDWIKKSSSNKKYHDEEAPLEENINEPTWIEKNINAGKVLEDLFMDLTETRVEYRKTRDSFKITEWLIDNNPEHLTELSNFLIECLTCNPLNN